MSNDKKNTFESQIAALETIVEQLEQGDLPLNESLAQFEKGVKLTKDCQTMLNKAEQKVHMLNDEQQLENFE
jgi:exodeoxyribonuclease VII small subunit